MKEECNHIWKDERSYQFVRGFKAPGLLTEGYRDIGERLVQRCEKCSLVNTVDIN